MNFIYVGCALVVAISLASSDDTNTENETPSNEWGNYFWLPNMTEVMHKNFAEAFRAYFNDPDKTTGCEDGGANLERWYRSSEKPNQFIFSFHCGTPEAGGYGYFKVELEKESKTFEKVLDIQTSLSVFGIDDTGDYESQVNDEDAQSLQSELLEKVEDQLAYQKNKWITNRELCPQPESQTLFSVETKMENGLYYYRFAISCNVSDTTGLAPDYMTNIEVAWDKEFGQLNGGEPILAVMEDPLKNTYFIQNNQ